MCSIPGSHKYYNVFIVQRRSIHSYLPAWWHIWNTDLSVCHGVRFYNRSSVYWKDGLICSYPLQAPPAWLVLSVTKPVYREYMKCMHSHINFLIIFLFYERIFPNTLPRTNRPRAVIESCLEFPEARSPSILADISTFHLALMRKQS